MLDVNVENNIIIDKTLIKNYIKGEISFHTIRKNGNNKIPKIPINIYVKKCNYKTSSKNIIIKNY